MKDLLTDVNNQFKANKVVLKDYMNILFEFCKMFKHFGKALSFAFAGKYTLKI